MSVESAHPFYATEYEKWLLCCDSYDGEEAIKNGGTKYLPMTSGQIEDGADVNATSSGAKAYEAYKTRAVYNSIFREAVEAAVGIMHREPPTIELPAALEPMREKSTLLGESLELLLRKINTRQIITGRVGLLGDLKDTTEGLSSIVALYNELAIINWDDTSANGDVGLVVLDESGYVLEADFTWLYKNKYRVLALIGENKEIVTEGSYASGVLQKGDDIAGSLLDSPNLLGDNLNEIPFVFVNSKDLSPTPDVPPLEGLARLCLAIYRGEADYRQNLFMQGQDTLVLIGSHTDDDETVRTGAGSRIDVPINGDAKYIGVDSQGLPEQRMALENDYKQASQKSGQLMDATSRAKESGEALRIRVSAQTATLPQIAKTGAAALEKVLKSLAKWYGADPDEVKVTPNLEFSDSDLDGQTLMQIVQAKALGAPISEESLHVWLQEHGVTKMTYDEEIDKLANEEPFLGTAVSSPLDGGE